MFRKFRNVSKLKHFETLGTFRNFRNSLKLSDSEGFEIETVRKFQPEHVPKLKNQNNFRNVLESFETHLGRQKYKW